MALFRRKKIEVIDLKIIEKSNQGEVDNTDFYSEKIDYEKDNFNSLNQEAKKSAIDVNYSKVKKSYYEVNNEYLVCKIFSKIVLKDRDFQKEIDILDKHIDRVKKEYESLQNIINEVKFSEGVNEEKINEAYDKLRSIEAFHYNIQEILQYARNQHFNLLKMATVNVCLNKSNQELENIFENLNLFLLGYKNLREASEYIFYNSGSVILELVEKIIKIIDQSSNKEHLKTYDIKYFLKSDVVITLEYTEWIVLFNKIKNIIKLLGDQVTMKNVTFKEKFKEFEIRYLILMMNLETLSKPKKI